MGEADPATAIVRTADARSCDLIVMGTHGRTGGIRNRFEFIDVTHSRIHDPGVRPVRISNLAGRTPAAGGQGQYRSVMLAA